MNLKELVVGQVVKVRNRPAVVIQLAGKKHLKLLDYTEAQKIARPNDGRKVVRTANGHSVQEM
jgi:hypothetical protein